MNKLIVALMLLIASTAYSDELDPLVDYRMGETVMRVDSGATMRSKKVIAKFKELYACPSNGNHSGACPGWAIDHVIPLACGGRDAVYNMQWLPATIKSASGSDKKDRFERKVYGGNHISKGCP